MRVVLLALVSLCVTTASCCAEHVTIGPGSTMFKFTNGIITIADDITITLVTGTQMINVPGSTPDGTHFKATDPASNGGSITFNQGGGAGVSLGQTSQVDFTGWAVGTVFDVTYSHPGGLSNTDPGVQIVGEIGPFDVQVFAVHEPSTLATSGTALLMGAACAWRRRRQQKRRGRRAR